MDPDRLETMAKLFGIALLIVAPWGVVRIRRTLRDLAAQRESAPVIGGGSIGSDRDDRDDRNDQDDAHGSEVADRATVDVATLVAAIERHRGNGSSEELVLVVPPDAHVNGRPAPPGVAEALLDDAARRSGIALRWSTAGDDRVARAAGATD